MNMTWDDGPLKVEVKHKSETALRKAAMRVATNAKRSMGSGAAGRSIIATQESSRMYTRTKKKKIHWSSPPGEPPHVDTGRLRASISWILSTDTADRGVVGGKAEQEDAVSRPESRPNEIIAVVGTNVEYGKFLELGTEKMKARPWLRPALEKAIAQIRGLFEA